MKATIVLSTLIPIISAHTRFTTLFVNSQSQGDGTCIRMDMNPSTTTNFISGITSPDMACGVEGDIPVNRTCPLKPGDSISLLHRLWTDGTQPGSIDPSHKGTTAVYMKKLADAGSKDPYSTSASGDGWFKITFNGYDESSKQWGTEKMIANDGKTEAKIPSDLPGGYYLVRSEILALQNIIDNKVAPQFYAGCAQVYVDSSKSGEVNAQTASVPGYIDSSTSALTYDIYANVLAPFVEFGPKVYGSVSSRAIQNLVARTRRFRWDGGRWGSWNNAAGQSTDSDSNSDSGSDNSDANVDASTPAPIVSATASIASSATVVASTVPTMTSSDGSDDTNMVASSTSSTTSTTSTTSSASSKPTPTTQSNTISSSSDSTSSIVGTCPSNTVLTVANQCLTEIPSWSDDTPGALPKCWAASQQCWDTNSECWNNLSPAINTQDYSIGCHAWENKCNAIVDWCHAGNLQGPPAWDGGNVKMVKRGRSFARRVVAAERRVLRR